MLKKRNLIIILLIVLILLITIFFIYRLVKNEETGSFDINDSVSELSFEEQEIYRNQLFDQINNYNTFLYEEYPIKNMNSLSDVSKTKFILDILFLDNSESITLEEVVEKANDYFDKFNIYKGNIGSYSYSNNSFTKGVEDMKYCNITTMPIEVKHENDTWLVKEKYYYQSVSMRGDAESFVVSVFSDKKSCDDNKNRVLKVKNSNAFISDEDYMKISNKLNNITYKFINKNGNYIISSISLK